MSSISTERSDALFQPQNLIPPLYTEHTTWVNGNRTASDMHWHNCAEIGLCTSGSGLFFVGNRVRSFTKGCVTFMPGGLAHIAQSPDDSPSEWKFIFVDLEKAGIRCSISDGLIIPHRDLRSLFSMLFDSLSNGREDTELSFCLMKCLVLMFSRLSDSVPAAAQTHHFRTVLPAVNHIQKNYGSAITVSELAKICGISVSLFHRTFRSATGMPPMEYVNYVRIQSAENLLAFTDMRIIDISEASGFESLSSFSRQFGKYNLMSPREFRKRKRAENR